MPFFTHVSADIRWMYDKKSYGVQLVAHADTSDLANRPGRLPLGRFRLTVCNAATIVTETLFPRAARKFLPRL